MLAVHAVSLNNHSVNNVAKIIYFIVSLIIII